jgi:hypothetical protein
MGNTKWYVVFSRSLIANRHRNTESLLLFGVLAVSRCALWQYFFGCWMKITEQGSTPLTVGLRGRGLAPIIGQHGNAPNVSRLIKFDPTVHRVGRININNPSRSTLVRQVDMNRNSHSSAQPNGGCDQCSVKVDGDGLAVAPAAPRFTLHRKNHLQRDAGTSSGLVKRRRGRHPRSIHAAYGL